MLHILLFLLIPSRTIVVLQFFDCHFTPFVNSPFCYYNLSRPRSNPEPCTKMHEPV